MSECRHDKVVMPILCFKRIPMNILRHNYIVRHPELILEGEIYRELREKAIAKYKRDKATYDQEKFIALYMSACVYELKRNSHKYLIEVR